MRKCVLLVSLLAILVLVFVCVWLTSRVDWEYVGDKLDGGTHTSWREDIHYAFDPQVVSNTLPAGDFLTPLPSGIPLPTTEPASDPAVLDEEVFYAIASRLVEEEGLGLIAARFWSPCAYAGSGLGSMVFEYIKRRDDARGFPYLYVWVDVNLDTVSYDIYEMTAAAPEARMPILDYEGLEIKALEAIRIAEDHGGRDFRSRVSDACEIYGGLLEDGTTWSVRYRTEEESPALRFEIDATTGEVIAMEQ